MKDWRTNATMSREDFLRELICTLGLVREIYLGTPYRDDILDLENLFDYQKFKEMRAKGGMGISGRYFYSKEKGIGNVVFDPIYLSEEERGKYPHLTCLRLLDGRTRGIETLDIDEIKYLISDKYDTGLYRLECICNEYWDSSYLKPLENI